MGDITRYFCAFGSMIPDDTYPEREAWVRYKDHAAAIEVYKQRDEAHQQQVREAYHRQLDAEAALSHAIQESRVLSALLEKVSGERDALRAQVQALQEIISILEKRVFELETANLELSAQVPWWIPVGERLPDTSGIYLVVLDYGERPGDKLVDYAEFSLGQWNLGKAWKPIAVKRITHWMPLPDPPKGPQ